MRLATLEHNGFDWDDGNTSKIESRVPVKEI